MRAFTPVFAGYAKPIFFHRAQIQFCRIQTILASVALTA
jgi:hypothetical protein